MMTLFSVVMPTRNRPALFRAALGSVLRQTCASYEIIVVVDGVSNQDRPRYEAMAATFGDKACFCWLDQWQRGHGQSYAMNFGAALARGTYLCFLDDDDVWTDPGYLARVQRTIEASSEPVDLHFSNQAAFLLDEQRPGPIWLEDLTAILPRRGRRADPHGIYRVDVADLLASHGFCHLNTMIVRRALFDEIGGMDQDIWWECDRDVYLRLIDRAVCMLYAPEVVARHNIPDPAKSANMTTAISVLKKRLYQTHVLEKSIMFSKHHEIRMHCRLHRSYALKRITELFVNDTQYQEALYWAMQAFAAGPTLKWSVYTLVVFLKYFLSRGLSTAQRLLPVQRHLQR